MTDYARGDVLRELRASRRLSRENVAAEVGVTTKTLFTWEKQSGPIKWDNAKRLAAFYNVAPDSLVSRDPDEAEGLPSRAQLDRMEANQQRMLDNQAEMLRLLAVLVAPISSDERRAAADEAIALAEEAALQHEARSTRTERTGHDQGSRRAQR